MCLVVTGAVGPNASTQARPGRPPVGAGLTADLELTRDFVSRNECVGNVVMADTPRPRETAFTRVRGEMGADAWREFVRLYGPIVYRFARKRGLTDADAADLMQEALRSVAGDPGAGEPASGRGTPRSRLFAFARGKLIDLLATRKDRPRGVDGSRFAPVPDRRAEPDSDWDGEFQRQLTAKAMDRVRREFHSATWQAFWKTAVDGRAAPDVGAELGMTLGAVFVAKSRVLARLREEVLRLERQETPTGLA